MNNKMFINMRSKFFVGVLSVLAMPALAQNTQVKPTINSFLNDSISIAYGPKQSRRNTIYSISTVRSESLKRFNTPNLGNTLYGQLAGLQVSQTGSAPGNNDNPNLSIRGRQTFVDNGLMVLVDGFETTWSTIMPDEIESISVLKDAGALALYGLDGANGVVLITTKRGKVSDKNQIKFSSRFGVQSASVLPSLLGNGDYAELYNVAMVSDGKAISSGYFKDQTIVDQFKSGANPYLYPDVNWADELLKPNSLSQDYSLSITGGRSDAKYFVALGYAGYKGLYGNTDADHATNSNYNLQRFNLRANFDVNITKFLTTEVGFRGTMLNKYFPNADENALFKSLSLFNPYPVRNENGSWGGTQGFSDNPVASVLQKGYQSINDRSVDANVKVIGKLDFITSGLRAFGQLNFYNFYYSTYNKTRGFAYQELTARPDLIQPGVTPAGTIPYTSTVRGASDNAFLISQGTGNQINRTNVIAGAEYGRNFGNHAVYASSMYFQELLKGRGNELDYAKQSIMGRLSYNYKEKYFSEFGYAYSGSENFPKGSRFGFFPSLSLGWMLNKENFLKNATAIDLLKIRGSVGLLGNDRAGSTGRFIFKQFYSGGSAYPIGSNLGTDAPTYNQGTLANPNVTWEKSLKSNIGLDAIFFQKLSMAVDYFYERRSDIFINPSGFVPAVLGANLYSYNRGKTQSSGTEVELVYNSSIKKIGYYIGGNASFQSNKILNMEEPYKADSYLYAKGQAINQPFVLQAIGFFKDQDDINQSPQQLFGNVRPGDVKYKDLNNDKVIDDRDRSPVGNTSYPNIYYGFNAGLNFKGFDVNVFLQGAAGRTVSLLDNQSIVPFLNGGVKPSQWVKDNYWTPEKGDAAKFPRLTTETNDNNYRPSTLWQRDGSYIRLRNVELGYTIPKRLTQRVNVSGLRVFVSGNNLHTWHKIKELEVDPEVMNMFVHPAFKSYNFGLSLQL